MADIVSLASAAEIWEIAGYCCTGLVLLGVIGETIVEFRPSFFCSDTIKHRAGKISALILIIGISGEILTQVEANNLTGLLIANLNSETENIRSANIKLESMIEPRSLSVDEQSQLSKSLIDYAGRRVAVVSFTFDAEAAHIGVQLISVLSKARIEVVDLVGKITPMGTPLFDINVGGVDRHFVNALRDILTSVAHIRVASEEKLNNRSPLMTSTDHSPNEDPPVNAIIVIGVKPPGSMTSTR